MDRNYKLLRLILISIAIISLLNCFGKYDSEYLLDLPDYNPTLKEAVGTYYFVPIKDEFSNRDDYKYLNLKRGDTLFLEIKEDSTYLFNKFFYTTAFEGSFYSKVKLKNNLNGKFIRGYKATISLLPGKDVKDASIFLVGFKKSHKTGMHYYYGISSPSDPTEFEYFLIYNRLKN